MPMTPVPISKLIVIDDDPTGSQTVHSCLLLLNWQVETLMAGLQHPANVFFILANTRALPRQDAEVRLRAICRNLRQALKQLNLEHWQLVSRGDSTLRSHFPLEAQVLSQELGPFAVVFLLPAFLPGGRTTVGGHHCLHGQPVHRSSYARDSRFGYTTSSLAAWVEQKSGGRVPQATVTGLHWESDDSNPGHLLHHLASLPRGAVVTVDASEPEHLRRFGELMQGRRQQGHRDLCWGAASLINALVDPGPQMLTPKDLAALRRRDAGRLQPGLVLLGSHQPGADRQLATLLTVPSVKGLEIPLERLQQGPDPALATALAAALEHTLHQERRTVVLYTSRGERLRGDEAGQLALARAVAQLQETLLAPLAPSLGYVISKGGSTSDTLLRHGLGLDHVVLRGQVMPGISLVQPPVPKDQAALPVVCVPGNMGTDETLLDLHRLMEPEHNRP